MRKRGGKSRGADVTKAGDNNNKVILPSLSLNFRNSIETPFSRLQISSRFPPQNFLLVSYLAPPLLPTYPSSFDTNSILSRIVSTQSRFDKKSNRGGDSIGIESSRKFEREGICRRWIGERVKKESRKSDLVELFVDKKRRKKEEEKIRRDVCVKNENTNNYTATAKSVSKRLVSQ